jgi:tetratricopeptide (TPR) repeat protein
MTRDSWILGLTGVCFGILIGWIIGSQSGRPGAGALTSPSVSASPQSQQGGQPQGAQNPTAAAAQQTATPPPALDEAQARTLAEQATARPQDAKVRAQLGNLYFDAERYTDAITWYQASLKINPRDANVSTDLAVSYYYTNQTDRALRQFDASLAIDPRHTKTMLNVGMVKAFGKQDLAGAAEAWKQVVQLAPDSPEGRAARQALESLKAAHPDPGDAPAAAPAPKGGA